MGPIPRFSAARYKRERRMTIPKAALGSAVETNSFEGIQGISPMLRNILALGLLAASLVAPRSFAQAAPTGTAVPSANAIDAASIQALKDMGAFLQTLKRFHVSTEATGERVLADGQKLQHVATAALDVQRPNKLHARMVTPRAQRELIYDGKTVTVYMPAQKYYSTIEFTETIGALIDRLGELDRRVILLRGRIKRDRFPVVDDLAP